MRGGISDDTIKMVYALLNHILDRGIINASATYTLGCTDARGRRIIKFALSKRLIRWHHVKLVATHSARYRDTHKVYTITREGVRFIYDYDRLRDFQRKGGF
jgi:predicted transcriptional regulator